MNTRLTLVKAGIFVLVILCGLIMVTLQWDKNNDLPVLDKAEPFTLQSITEDEYSSDNGKVKLLAFFYTNCPDICPLTMSDFKKLQDELKLKEVFGTKAELVAITLDPEEDNLQTISEYAQKFEADPEGWIFLRGTPEQTKEVADSYHMKFKKVSGDYIAHNTTMFLIDSKNQIRGLYDMANTKKAVENQEILEAIHLLINE
ncbi:SCO family protein [Mesobacillus foraminis]|uniref:SCO family protein n=1 Tax=Mesobacillus foraminis TaxID=279826 RepID=UPI001BEC0ECC|nr:SCO family protein [Mesobacillus foraminis]MBT2756336.1 SCO family protein [Mesobacillus foraminis]